MSFPFAALSAQGIPAISKLANLPGLPDLSGASIPGLNGGAGGNASGRSGDIGGVSTGLGNFSVGNGIDTKQILVIGALVLTGIVALKKL